MSTQLHNSVTKHAQQRQGTSAIVSGLLRIWGRVPAQLCLFVCTAASGDMPSSISVPSQHTGITCIRAAASGHLRRSAMVPARQHQSNCEDASEHIRSRVREPAQQHQSTCATASAIMPISVWKPTQQRQCTFAACSWHKCSSLTSRVLHPQSNCGED